MRFTGIDQLRVLYTSTKIYIQSVACFAVMLSYSQFRLIYNTPPVFWTAILYMLSHRFYSQDGFLQCNLILLLTVLGNHAALRSLYGLVF